jgi:ABC-type branched-subunit amino acid transport system substrate-binding protein
MTSDLQGELLANFAASVPNLKRVAVISHRDTWGLASLEPALNRLRTQYKMEPVATEALDRGANDSTPQTLRLKAANPDVVIMILYEKEGAVFLRDTVKYGLDSVIVGPTAMQDLGKIVELAGTNAVARKLYILRDTPYAMNEPPMAGVVERIKARYPSVSFVNSSAAIIYSSASVIVEGLRRAGRDLTRDKFLKELESLQGFADGGLLPGTVTFSPTEHRGRKSGVFGVYKEGKVVSIGDKYVPLP